VVFKDFIIKNDSQPLVSNETTSQRTRRVPVAYNMNSSSTTRSRSFDTAEGKPLEFEDIFNVIPQRSWLSYWYPNNYIVNSIGGTGSFVYIIGSGVNSDHIVSNFFHFVGFFKPKI
jgi:hypothetical protein